MKKIFSEEAMQMYATADGLAVVYRCSEENGKICIGFRRIVFKTGQLKNVPKSFYLLSKFGEHYRNIESVSQNYLTCQAMEIGQDMLLVETDGSAKRIDESGEIIWQGDLKYRNAPPKSIGLSNRSFWASYPEDNSLIRFNLKTMREELKLGGPRSAFSQPEGIWIDGDEMMVCNAGSGKLWKVNLSSYAVTEYASFNEPVHRYLRHGTYEFVLLDSGIYLLEHSDL